MSYSGNCGVSGGMGGVSYGQSGGFQDVPGKWSDNCNSNLSGNGSAYGYVYLPQGMDGGGGNGVDNQHSGGFGGHVSHVAAAEGQNNSGVPVGYGMPLSGIPLDGKCLYDVDNGRANPHLRRFVKKGCKDVWAAVIFLMFFLMAIIWGVVNLARGVVGDSSVLQLSEENDGGSWLGEKKELHLFISVGMAFVCSMITGGFSMVLLQWFPRGIIYVSCVISVLFSVALAVVGYMFVSIVIGLIFTVLAIFTIIWFVMARHRIPFTAAVLKTSSLVLSRYKAIFVFKFLSIVVLFGFMWFWVCALIPSVQQVDANTADGIDVFIFCLFAFTFYWTLQVIPNVMHVMTSGVTATWYFVGFQDMPSNPTLQSLKRAITTSFGSVCFGSLLVAVIQFLRWLIASGSNGQGNFLACCLMCLLGCIEALVKQFNTYAFVHVAMYGYDYITAARHTFELIKQCLCAGLFHTCLVNPTLNILSLIFSLAIGVIMGLIFLSVPLGIVGFLIGIMVHSLIFSAVCSAAVTIFVCFAEVPEALAVTDPALYRIFVVTDNGGTRNNAAV